MSQGDFALIMMVLNENLQEGTQPAPAPAVQAEPAPTAVTGTEQPIQASTAGKIHLLFVVIQFLSRLIFYMRFDAIKALSCWLEIVHQQCTSNHLS